MNTTLRRIFLLFIFGFFLFNYIKKDDYVSISGLLLIILFIDHNLQKKMEGFEPNTEGQTVEEETVEEETVEEEAVEEEAVEEEAVEEEAVEEEAVEEEAVEEEAVEEEAVEEEAVEEEAVEETDNRDELPISDDDDFKVNDKAEMTVINNKFRMGPYDSLCLSSDKLQDPGYINNSDLKTYFGVQGPLQVTSPNVEGLKGPTIDGDEDSPQKLSIFANNKTSFNCCHESPFMSSSGCVCLTEKQRDFIRTRGFNNMSNSSL
jgi:hypothetical protein